MYLIAAKENTFIRTYVCMYDVESTKNATKNFKPSTQQVATVRAAANFS